MRIRFLRAYTVAAVDGPTYEAGSVHNLSEWSAQHFLRRRIAVADIGTEMPAVSEEPPKAPVTIPEERDISGPDVDLHAAFADAEERDPERPAKRGRRK